jgi:hypothetical protein
VTELNTFNSGEFYYLGLIPGQYEAYIDPDQLSRLGYECQPPSLKFEVDPASGKEFVENLDFVLIPTQEETDGE